VHTRISPVELCDGQVTWEQQYHDHLRHAGRLRPQAELELKRCTERSFGALNRSREAPHFASGVIVGAVQAGKTGLMVNLAARALDTGFRVVVVLAGLKDDLRTQTAQRFVSDLLQRGDEVTGATDSFTHPLGKGYHGHRRDCWAPRYDEDVNHDEAFIHLFCSNLRRNNGVLAVAKKNVATLNRLREALEHASSEAGHGSLPILILDDECDEASVSGDPDAPTPDRIAELWADIPQYVAYIGLTATPAANLLQETSSPLFPRGFVLSLKAPGDRESSLTYLEPEFDRRYTGGEVFYKTMEGHERANFLVRSAMSDPEFDGVLGADDELEEALIAYFVAGAIRLQLRPGSDLDDAAHVPPPHTMMAHTESRVESHWALCERVVSLTRRKAGKPGEVRENLRKRPPRGRLAADDLAGWLQSESDRWRAWYESFLASRNELFQIAPDRLAPRFPTWEETRESLPAVFRGVQLRVVNSDEASSDKPLQFQPTYSSEGIKPPRDVYSIIIGGNRLSRGLTIEGLCISYYTRSSSQFLEDTTIQRERWFGYRGSHLEFCRLFTHRSLAIRLQCFHEHEEDLRKQLAWNIEKGREPLDATYRFLTIRDSLPTAKRGRGTGPDEIDVSGAKPFVDRVQMGTTSEEVMVARANQAHALAIASRVLRGGETLLTPRRELQGYVLREVRAADIAACLEGFSYTFHNPEPSRGAGWNLKEYYRPPTSGLAVTGTGMPPRSDPFLIAAYLKYWHAAFEECQRDPSKNTFRGADAVSRWRPCPSPNFNLAVRCGSRPPANGSPFTFDLLDRAVDRTGVVGSRWGGRGYGTPGDEWIDMPPPGGDADAPRPEGVPGLLLLHVIGRDAQGREGAGESYAFDRPCVGLVVPAGGPCIRYVLSEDGP
jgi:Z1 domain